MKNLSNSVLGNLAISAPSLPEQHRIVAILDEAFDGIATAKANAKKNLQNARAFFESHLQSVFAERGEGQGNRTYLSFPGAHATNPNSCSRNSSSMHASSRLDLMLALRTVLYRNRFSAMWRSTTRLLAA